MKQLSNILTFSLLALVMCAACKKEPVAPEVVKVESVSVNPTSLEMVKGEVKTIVATVSPENATNKNVRWSSSDPSVATVENGKVSAVNPGTAVITATAEDGGRTASCEVSVPDTTPYLCLETESGVNHLKILNLNASLEYSFGDGAWKEYRNNDVVAFGDGAKLFLRGRGNNTGDGPIGNFVFQDNVPVLCSGNIMTLLQYDDVPADIRRPGCFVALFQQCSCLAAAPELPAAKLSASCYNAMFYGCISLVEPPVLPAVELADYCYSQMFEGCSSLAEAPALPATELSRGCYSRMFHWCSFSTAPQLPAAVMKPDCYSEMFCGCSNIKEVPALPATELAESCYRNMFKECISLDKAPSLPATTLAPGCYGGMFHSCSALEVAPELPATELADRCYDSMFLKCRSLTVAPELPAGKLCSFCYSMMFADCSSLNYVKALFTELDEYGSAISFFLDRVAPVGTFVKNKAATWDNYGIVPEGWTVVTED